MTVLKIIGLILGSLTALILLLLLLPVDIELKTNPETCDLCGGVRILGIRIVKFPNSNPKKKKKKEAKTSKDEANPKKKSSGMKIGELIQIIRLILNRLAWVISHCRLRRFRVLCICAGPDPAQTATDYGMACASLYPFMGYLQSSLRQSPNVMDVRLQCDFEADAPRFSADIVMRVLVFRLIQAGWHILWNLLQSKMKKEPNYESSKSKAETQQ